MSQFVSLHQHSYFSLLDGLPSPKGIVNKAKELGYPAIAVTDHGVMHGSIELYRECLKQGIKPIIGCEGYLKHQPTTDHLKDFVAEADGDYKVKGLFHQLILAINRKGYENLCKLTSLAHLTEGRGAKSSKSETSTKSKSWMLLEELEKYSEGLLVTSGCMAGIIPQALRAGDLAYAEEMALWYKRVFADRFYIEIQDHAANDGSDFLNVLLIGLADKLQIEVVATSDSHYLNPCDKEAHDALLCINTGKLLSDEKRMRYEGAYWLPTGDEMVKRLSVYLPTETAVRAVENTVRIAERVEDYQLKGTPTPPKFKLPDDYDNPDDYLEDLAYEGLRNRFYGMPPQDYIDRLQYELDVFKSKNLAEYFLVVGDICNFCRNKDIWMGAGRGSSAGSLVSYALKITNIDPIHFGLIFSRFINEERMSYPDIDMDIDKERRHEVIEYLCQKYGSSQVAQIATFNKLVSASALKDTAKVLDIDYGFVNRLTTRIPVVRGNPALVSEMIVQPDIYPEFYKLYQSDIECLNKEGLCVSSFKQWVDLTTTIEGTVKSIGIHAAGAVIGWQPLDELIPLMKGKDGGTVAQYSMEDLEYLGLLKMDLLGLKTISVIRRTIESIYQTTGELIDVESINLNDLNVLKNMVIKDCAGIFQFEADGAMRLLAQIKPTSIDDVSAITSLNRPGCLDLGMHTDYARRKAGLDRVTYLVPELQEILGKSYGLCIFQEQMLNICHKIAGWSLGKSDNARKGCLSGDTIITLSNGSRTTIRNFARDFQYLPSTKIQALNTSTYKATEGQVLDAFFNGYRDTYEITTKTGRKIRATTNHEFFKLDEWASIDSGLKVGDSIALPVQIDITKSVKTSPLSDSIIKACAYLIGDGYLGRKGEQKRAYFCNSDEWLLDDFTDCITRQWKNEPDRKYQQAEHQPNPIGYVYLTPGQREFFAQKISYGVSGDRHIPSWVWELDRRQLKVFLGALWCTDGCFSVDSEDPRSQGEYSSTSLDLIEALQECFLKIGIVTSYNKKTQKYKGKPYVSHRLWVSGKEDVLMFHKELSEFLSPIKKEQARKAYAYTSAGLDSYSKYCVPAEVIKTIKDLKPENKSWRGLGIESGFGKDLSAGINFSAAEIKGQRSLSRRKTGAFAKALNNNKLKHLATSDVLWDKITSIDYVGVEDVYDLTINEHHNFVANGFYVHNCGKKLEHVIKPLEKDFIEGCNEKWIDEPIAAQLWEIVLASAGYTFNASHAYCYSILTMQTAWLKHYYPVHFMAALCSMEENKKQPKKKWEKEKTKEEEEESRKLANYLIKCKSYGLKILPPNINESGKDFTVVDDSTIRWSLGSIKGLGDAAINPILLERSLRPFDNLEDFFQRTNVNANALVALIKSGALDCLHPNRNELQAYIEPLKEWRKKAKAKEARALDWGQQLVAEIALDTTGFNEVQIAAHVKNLERLEKNYNNALTGSIAMPEMATKKDWTFEKKLKGEKEVLGLYSSGHPLDRYPVGCEPFENIELKKPFVSTVQVNRVKEGNSKQGTMLYVDIEDKLGAVTVLKVFNKQYVKYGHLFTTGAHVSIKTNAQEWKGKTELILEVALQPTEPEVSEVVEVQAQAVVVGAWEDPDF